MNAFESAAVSGLRAAQLRRRCTPRVEHCEKVIMTVLHDAAIRQVRRRPAASAAPRAHN